MAKVYIENYRYGVINMSIKTKLLIPMVIISAILAVVILLSGIIVFNNYITQTISEEVNVISRQVLSQLDNRWDDAIVSTYMLASDNDIREGVATGDRDLLAKRLSELSDIQQTDFCTITDKDGIVIYRAHEPDNFGDSVTSQGNITSAMAGVPLTQYETGTAVKLSVRAGVPVYGDSGEVIGVISTGYRFDTDTFVDRMKEITDAEVTIFLGDTRLSTTVIGEDGKRAVGTQAAENVSAQVLSGKTYSGEAVVAGQNAFTHYEPLVGTDGNVIGMVFVGRYTTERDAAMLQYIIIGGSVAVALILIAVFVIFSITKRVFAPIETLSGVLRDVGVTGNIKIDKTQFHFGDGKRDEVGEAVEAFEHMLDKFVYYGDMLEKIADRDLTANIKTAGANDTIGNAMTGMVSHLNEIFGGIRASAEEVSTGSDQIAGASQTLAEGAQEQASAVGELSSAIAVVSDSVTLAAEAANSAAELADKVADTAQVGSKQMEDMVAAVTAINTASQNISNVIKVIDDIAFQTNILALNAAVEAARAGEAGKGFAVVADEVRNLAAKSANAAKETNDLILDSMNKAKQGVVIAGETSRSLNEIIEGIGKSHELSLDIAKKSGEQSLAITEINKSLEQVSNIVRQNSATSEESAASAEELSSQSQLLRHQIAKFKLKS
jgi:methyl-accepting chemotaxis protein